MIVYRLTKAIYKNDLSGRGAEKAGGRWNSKGTALLYTSASRALCTVEIAVHTPLGNIPKDYFLITIHIEEPAEMLKIKIADLPQNWKSFPPAPATQQTGDQFVSESKFLILQVPSAVVPGDFNYLVNPSHTLFTSIRIVTIEPYAFDDRLFVK